MDAAAVAREIRDTDRLVIGLGPGQPGALLHALGERDRFDDLRVFAALLADWYTLFTRPGVKLQSGFFGPVERLLGQQGHDIEFVPADFRGFIRIAEQLDARVVATAGAPPDADGRLSLSLHAGATVAELHRAGADPGRLLIAEVNHQLPRTLGCPPEHPHSLHVDEVDLLYEVDRPVFTLDEPPPSPTDLAIARHVRPFVHDGCTLQTGIGGVPNAVVKLLAEGEGGDYGIHSEMFTTGLMQLTRAGKVTNRKGVYDGFSAATFAAGTRELYDWLEGNEAVRFLPVERVNDPAIIARNRQFVSVNGALSVDLHGQIVADSLSGAQFSGIGGHEDFVAGAHAGRGGRSLVCLPATVRRDGRLHSRIVSRHPAGSLVTTPRHQTDVIVTEYGAAELPGRSVRERAEALARVAHPAFRDALLAGETDLGTVPDEADPGGGA